MMLGGIVSDMDYRVRESDLIEIAEAIRLRTGNTEAIDYADFASEILTITGNSISTVPSVDPTGVWYKVSEESLVGIADSIRTMRGHSNTIPFENFKSEIVSIVGTPSRIEITTEPTKLEYSDGETIDFTGMVVTAYNEDDTVWTGYNADGSIPHSALTFPVTVADFSEE